jgi:peptidoglycan-N-acetylglucosamine deacetylase
MKKHFLLQSIVFIFFVFLTFNFLQQKGEVKYIPVSTQIPVGKIDKSDPLYIEIQEKAKEYEKEPEDARIDKVWKKIPGISGLKVNIEKSFLKMKEKGKFDENLLSFDEIKPNVHYKDLPPSPIFRGNPNKQMVSFLINVAWGEEYIPEMLKTLKEEKVKATFFIDGIWAQKHADLVKMIKEEGHEIGSHGYNHPNMSRLSEQEIKDQLVKTNNILKTITNEQPILFAPPAGNFKDSVVKIAHQMNMETILWTVDTIDWKNPTRSTLINRVMSKIEPGSMILMHPKEVTKDSLKELILKIKGKNYKIGTVSKLLDEER